MNLDEAIVHAIFEAFDAHNDLNPDKILAKDRSTRLFGEGGVLDSLAFVSFLLDLEEVLERRFGCRITLSDERALSAKHSPFRTVESLVQFAKAVLAEPVASGPLR